MRSRVFWRRSATAAGVYVSALLGFAGTLVAARSLSTHEFGLLALVLAATGFFQLFADLTVDEALVKYGFRYLGDDPGRLRRVFEVGLRLKSIGGIIGCVGIAILAPLAHALFGADGLVGPLLVASFLPLVQAPEGVAASALIVRRQYDVRAGLLTFSMALRLAGIAIGAQYGVLEAVAGIVLAQVVSTLAISAVALTALRPFVGAPATRLGDDRPAFRSFVVQSSIGSVLSPMRGLLGTLLLGIVTGPLQVAYFRAAQAPQSAFASLSSPARLILLGEQTHQFEQGRTDLLFRTLKRYILGTSALMIVVVPPLLLAMPTLVRIAYGGRYEPATDAARLILLVAAIQVVWGWSKSLPVSIGRPGLRILAQATEIAVLVPTLLVLGALYGATGAAGAFLIAAVAFAAVWVVLLLRLRREPPRLEPRVAVPAPEVPRTVLP
jgi:O-antigen/teichoic acid export membrane protein